MNTAIEVQHRIAEMNLKLKPLLQQMHERFSPGQMLSEFKVPLIKYGRQKRRHRRLFPRVDDIKIVI